MQQEQTNQGGNDRHTDVTRSQHQQAEAVANESNNGEENRPRRK